MDLSQFDTVKAADVGEKMEVRHPVTKAPLIDKSKDPHVPVTITLAGADSERFRNAERSSGNRRLRETRRGDITVEAVQEDMVEAFAAATLAWEGIELDGQPLACSAENAKALYRRLPWLFEQVDVFVRDRANFLKASSPT